MIFISHYVKLLTKDLLRNHKTKPLNDSKPSQVFVPSAFSDYLVALQQHLAVPACTSGSPASDIWVGTEQAEQPPCLGPRNRKCSDLGMLAEHSFIFFSVQLALI